MKSVVSSENIVAKVMEEKISAIDKIFAKVMSVKVEEKVIEDKMTHSEIRQLLEDTRANTKLMAENDDTIPSEVLVSSELAMSEQVIVHRLPPKVAS